jgi:hypothetical protein
MLLEDDWCILTYLLTLLLVQHSSALDCMVVVNQLVETSNTGRSNRLGGCQTTLDRGVAENLSLILREGPIGELCKNLSPSKLRRSHNLCEFRNASARHESVHIHYCSL